jgi:hypothetical protein
LALSKDTDVQTGHAKIMIRIRMKRIAIPSLRLSGLFWSAATIPVKPKGACILRIVG